MKFVGLSGAMLALCAALLPAAARASDALASAASAWVTCGVPVARPSGGIFDLRGVGDGAGGFYTIWHRLTPNTAFSDIAAQRVLPDGTIAPGWPATGAFVTAAPQSQFELDAAADGTGGLLVTWMDARQEGASGTEMRVYVQRLLPAGTRPAGWNVDGNRVNAIEQFQGHPKIAGDGAGGAWVTWEEFAGGGSVIRLQRFGPDGSPAPGWPAAGLRFANLAGDRSFPDVVADGSGAVVVWIESGALRGARVDATGALSAGWNADGNVLCSSPSAFGYPQLVRDATGGFYTVMLVNLQVPDVWLQRFEAGGSVSTGWTASGLGIGTGFGRQWQPSIQPDDVGGVYVCWRDAENYPATSRVTRVLASGFFAPGFPANGLALGPDPGSDPEPQNMASDSAGAVYVALEGGSPAGGGALVHRVLPNGTEDAAFPRATQPMCTAVDQRRPTITAAPHGGAYVATYDQRDSASVAIYATAMDSAGNVSREVANILTRVYRGAVKVGFAGGVGVTTLARIQRQKAGEDWLTFEQVVLDGLGRWVAFDGNIAEGGRVGYRVLVSQSGVDRPYAEIELIIPSALPMAVRLSPNPARDNLTVQFALRELGPASLDVFEVSGRHVRTVDLGSYGPGVHTVTVPGSADLRAGMYFFRVSQGNLIATGRGALAP